VRIIPLGEGPPESYGQEYVFAELRGARNVRMVRNVAVPSLSVHLPDPALANGDAVVVCPGGSFVMVSSGTAEDFANQLAVRGFTAFVLRYRVAPTPPSDEEVPQWSRNWTMDDLEKQSRIAVDDARLAVRTMREQAASFGVRRVGMLGFSAGGLLTIFAATAPDPADRPDYAASVYGPVFDEYTVPADAPTLFLTFATDDEGPTVVPANLALYQAWRDAGRPVELHSYAEGGHSYGWPPRADRPCDRWLDRFLDWHRHLDQGGR
jgi:acetyl esterase/lipase